MKIVCISKGINRHLTIGKTYDVIKEYTSEYIIIDDNYDNYTNWYPKNWFKTLAEYRNEQINKLLR